MKDINLKSSNICEVSMSGQCLVKVQTEEDVHVLKNLCFMAATWLEQEISSLEGQPLNSIDKTPKMLFLR